MFRRPATAVNGHVTRNEIGPIDEIPRSLICPRRSQEVPSGNYHHRSGRKTRHSDIAGLPNTALRCRTQRAFKLSQQYDCAMPMAGMTVSTNEKITSPGETSRIVSWNGFLAHWRSASATRGIHRLTRAGRSGSDLPSSTARLKGNAITDPWSRQVISFGGLAVHRGFRSEAAENRVMMKLEFVFEMES
jgi:hypothetical protein